MAETPRKKSWLGIPRWMVEAVLVLALFFGVRAWQTRDLKAGRLAPTTFITLSGRKVQVGGPSTEPTLLYFWASWCGVCHAQEGNIVELAKHARVITVASQSGSRDALAQHLREHNLSFEVIEDPQGTLAARFGVHAFPTSFFVSPEGSIAMREVGYTTALGLRARLWLASLR